MVKVRAATVILDRAGITERAAAESLHAGKQAEARHAKYLDDLEDPMSSVNLLRGVIYMHWLSLALQEPASLQNLLALQSASEPTMHLPSSNVQ